MELGACEELATDELRIGFHESEPIAMAVFRQLCAAGVRECRIELDIARKELAGGAHQRILDVVTDSGERAIADQLVFADLHLVSTDFCVVRMFFRQAHFRPCFEGGSADFVSTIDVLFIRFVVIEEVELDQLDTLVFEIDEGAVDTPACGSEVVRLLDEDRTERGFIAGTPIVRPVEPGEEAELRSLLASAAKSRCFLDLAEETLVTRDSDLPQAARCQIRAGTKRVLFGDDRGRVMVCAGLKKKSNAENGEMTGLGERHFAIIRWDYWE